MKTKNIAITFIIVLAGIHQQAQSMNFLRMHVGKIVVAGMAGTAFAYWKSDQAEKDHYLYDLNHNHIQKIADCKMGTSFSRGSRSAQHVERDHHYYFPEKYCDESEEYDFQTMVDDILEKKYREIPYGFKLGRKQREGLKNAVIFFAEQEAQHSETHYAFYHGTYYTPSLIFRTMMANTFDGEHNPFTFLLLREKGANDWLEDIQDPGQYIDSLPSYTPPLASMNGNMHGVDSRPEIRKGFLSANVPVMGNTGFYPGTGENSLVFISTLPCGMTNQSGPIVGLIPKILEPICFNVISLIDAGIRAISGNQITILGQGQYTNNGYMKETAYSYGNDIGEHFKHYQPELAELSRDTGGLIQILIPKEIVHGVYESEPFGRTRGDRSIEERLEEYKGADMQVRIPLSPSKFQNPDSGISMNMVVFTKGDRFENLVTRMSQIVEELHQSRD